MTDGGAVAQALQAAAVAVPLVLEASRARAGRARLLRLVVAAGCDPRSSHVPHPADEVLSLLYVGISPVRASSRQTVRSRVISNHWTMPVGFGRFEIVMCRPTTAQLPSCRR
jgi:hypothetical protein